MQHPSTARALLAGLVLALLSTASLAFDEHLAVWQAPDRAISAQVRGQLYPCTYALNAPTVTVTGNQVVVTSQLIGLGCPVVPGAQPFTYSQTAVIGVLANGAYVMTWSTNPHSEAEGFSLQTRLEIRNGGLVLPDAPPIPALQPTFLIVLIALLAVSGLRRFRRGAG